MAWNNKGKYNIKDVWIDSLERDTYLENLKNITFII